jgi:hypothetical protein
LPNRAFGTLHDPLPLPAYRGDRLAFAPHRRALARLFYVGLTHGPVSQSRIPASRSSGGFMIPTTPCPPEMYVDVPHLDCLLVAPPITVEGLDHVILKPKKFDRVVAVSVVTRPSFEVSDVRWRKARRPTVF